MLCCGTEPVPGAEPLPHFWRTRVEATLRGGSLTNGVPHDKVGWFIDVLSNLWSRGGRDDFTGLTIDSSGSSSAVTCYAPPPTPAQLSDPDGVVNALAYRGQLQISTEPSLPAFDAMSKRQLRAVSWRGLSRAALVAEAARSGSGPWPRLSCLKQLRLAASPGVTPLTLGPVLSACPALRHLELDRCDSLALPDLLSVLAAASCTTLATVAVKMGVDCLPERWMGESEAKASSSTPAEGLSLESFSIELLDPTPTSGARTACGCEHDSKLPTGDCCSWLLPRVWEAVSPSTRVEVIVATGCVVPAGGTISLSRDSGSEGCLTMGTVTLTGRVGDAHPGARVLVLPVLDSACLEVASGAPQLHLTCSPGVTRLTLARLLLPPAARGRELVHLELDRCSGLALPDLLSVLAAARCSTLRTVTVRMGVDGLPERWPDSEGKVSCRASGLEAFTLELLDPEGTYDGSSRRGGPCRLLHRVLEAVAPTVMTVVARTRHVVPAESTISIFRIRQADDSLTNIAVKFDGSPNNAHPGAQVLVLPAALDSLCLEVAAAGDAGAHRFQVAHLVTDARRLLRGNTKLGDLTISVESVVLPSDSLAALKLPEWVPHLHTLDLSRCQGERLQVPAYFGKTGLSRLKTFRPPRGLAEPWPAVVAGGVTAMQRYLADLAEGRARGEMKTPGTVKVMLIGDGTAGKTTLLEALMALDAGDDAAASGAVRERSRTVGIDVCVWQPKKLGEPSIGGGTSPLTLLVYDAAGQHRYTSTHTLFMTGETLYLLVFNLAWRWERIKSSVRQWAELVAAQPGPSGVVVVGTHLDQCAQDEAAQERVDDVIRIVNGAGGGGSAATAAGVVANTAGSNLKVLKKGAAVSCKSGTGLDALLTVVVEHCRDPSLFPAAHSTPVPTSFMVLAQAIMRQWPASVCASTTKLCDTRVDGLLADKLRSAVKEAGVVEWSAWVKVCETAGGDPASAGVMAMVLESMGVVVRLGGRNPTGGGTASAPDATSGPGYVVVNPQFMVDVAKRLIRAHSGPALAADTVAWGKHELQYKNDYCKEQAGEDLERLVLDGIASEKLVRRVLLFGLPDGQQAALLQLMCRVGLVVELKRRGAVVTAEQLYLIPAYLDGSPSPTPTASTGGARSVACESEAHRWFGSTWRHVAGDVVGTARKVGRWMSRLQNPGAVRACGHPAESMGSAAAERVGRAVGRRRSLGAAEPLPSALPLVRQATSYLGPRTVLSHRRVAVCIGNSVYTHPYLHNEEACARDARAVAERLWDVGFTHFCVRRLRQASDTAPALFGEAAPPATPVDADSFATCSREDLEANARAIAADTTLDAATRDAARAALACGRGWPLALVNVTGDGMEYAACAAGEDGEPGVAMLFFSGHGMEGAATYVCGVDAGPKVKKLVEPDAREGLDGVDAGPDARERLDGVDGGPDARAGLDGVDGGPDAREGLDRVDAGPDAGREEEEEKVEGKGLVPVYSLHRGLLDAHGRGADTLPVLMTINACRVPLPPGWTEPSLGSYDTEPTFGTCLSLLHASRPGAAAPAGGGHTTPFTRVLLEQLTRERARRLFVDELMFNISRKDLVPTLLVSQFPVPTRVGGMFPKLLATWSASCGSDYDWHLADGAGLVVPRSGPRGEFDAPGRLVQVAPRRFVRVAFRMAAAAGSDAGTGKRLEIVVVGWSQTPRDLPIIEAYDLVVGILRRELQRVPETRACPICVLTACADSQRGQAGTPRAAAGLGAAPGARLGAGAGARAGAGGAGAGAGDRFQTIGFGSYRCQACGGIVRGAGAGGGAGTMAGTMAGVG